MSDTIWWTVIRKCYLNTPCEFDNFSTKKLNSALINPSSLTRLATLPMFCMYAWALHWFCSKLMLNGPHFQTLGWNIDIQFIVRIIWSNFTQRQADNIWSSLPTVFMRGTALIIPNSHLGQRISIKWSTWRRECDNLFK